MVFNPAELSEDLPYRLLLSRNLSWICEEAEGMVSLFGCEASKGARAETRVAQACGIPRWVHMPKDKFYSEMPDGRKLRRVEEMKI